MSARPEDNVDRIRPTDAMSAQQRRELIDAMRPEDAEGVPELHEVDIPEELKKQIEAAMKRYPETHSALIPALWAVQRHYGWCSPDGLRQAAAVLRLTPGELQSVASFYDLFHLEPQGSHDVLVCHNISCWMRGGDRLLEAFRDAAGDDPDFHVTGFECLGACDIAPMASVNETYFGPLEPGDAATIVEQLRKGAGPGEVLPDRALAKRPAAGGPEPEPDPRVSGVENQ